MKRLSSLLILIVSTYFLSAQSKAEFGANISAQAAKNDFKILVNSLLEVHPTIFKFQSEADFKRREAAVLNSFNDSVSELELHREIRRFIHTIGCGHTTAQPSLSWYKKQREDSKILPLTVYFNEKDQLFVKQAFDQDSLLKPGLEILSINGRSASSLLREMRAIQEVDGISEAYANNRILKLFGTYHLFLYGRSDVYELSYLDSLQQKQSLKLEGGKYGPSKRPTNALYGEALVSMDAAALFQFEDQPNWAILDHNGFKTRSYKKFYRRVFKELEKRDIQNLILDLRGNGGGYFPNGNRLLSYLLEDDFSTDFSRPKKEVSESDQLKMPIGSRITRFLFNLKPDANKEDPDRNYQLNYRPKKKHAYRGKLYVLTDGGTFSLGSLVATKLKHHRECLILGSETGGGEDGSNAVLMYNLVLPSSGIRMRIPYYFLDHKVEPELEGRGLIPDIIIDYQPDERLAAKDKELEYLFENHISR
ncbi:MAG: S41 family peptidase [Bacteroidetes bacterium]|nr:S41 family peptidase [Bacteroidota bacterium]